MDQAGPDVALMVIHEQVEPTPHAAWLLAQGFADWACWGEAHALLEGVPTPAQRILRANCLLGLGGVESAEAELDQIEPGSPEWRKALTLRCLAAWVRGDVDTSTALLAQLASRRSAAHLRSFQALLTGEHVQPPGALAEQKRWLNLVEKLLLLGRPDLARRAIALLEGVPGPIGRLLARYGQPALAEPYLIAALAQPVSRELPVTGGNRCDLLCDLGEVRLMLGRHAEAARSYQEAMA